MTNPLSAVIRVLIGESERNLPDDLDREDTEAYHHACFLVGDTYSNTPSGDTERRGLSARLWQLLKN
jgi:hypothetical protein